MLSVCEGADVDVDPVGTCKKHLHCGQEELHKVRLFILLSLCDKRAKVNLVSPRVELGLQDSESWVLPLHHETGLYQ